MRLPSLYFTAIAGLWQQPFLPEETVTSTRHVHITRTVTVVQSTVYAMRIGSSTMFMDEIPASLMGRFSSQATGVAAVSSSEIQSSIESIPTPTPCGSSQEQTDLSGHLELRSADATTSVRIVHVTMTAESVEATVYAASAGSSVSTLTSVPPSLVAEASSEAVLESSVEASVISSAEAEVMAHSTVAALAVETSEATTASMTNSSSTTQTQTVNAISTIATKTGTTMHQSTGTTTTNSSLPTSTAINSDIVSSTLSIGLELRSDSDITSTSHIHITKTVAESQSTAYEMQLSSSTSSMTSVASSIIAIASSEAVAAASSSSSETADITSAFSTTDSGTKSTQNALLESGTSSASLASTTQTDTGKSESTTATVSQSAESASIESAASESSSASTSSTTSSVAISSDQALTTLNIEWVPSTKATPTPASTPAVSASTSDSWAAIQSSSSASASASASTSSTTSVDTAAANLAGASGTDDSSFKLSKGGFAAIISVVSIGVGLGIISLLLFVLAKRRQWHIRASLSRASTRLIHPNASKPTHESEKPILPVATRDATLPSIQPVSARTANTGVTQASWTRGDDMTGGGRFARAASSRIPGAASRFPVVVRPAEGVVMSGAQTGLRYGQVPQVGQAAQRAQKQKPELRVDTRLAREMDEGAVGRRGWVRRLADMVRRGG